MKRPRQHRKPPAGLRRLGPGEKRPTCPRCRAPVFYRSHAEPAFYLCLGCCGFREGEEPLKALDIEEEVLTLPASELQQVTRRQYHRALALLESRFGRDLTRLLQRQCR